MSRKNDGANPEAEYLHRLDHRRAAAARLASWHIGIGNIRLAMAGIAGILAWLAFRSKLLSAWWMALPILAFVLLVVVHDRVRQQSRRLNRAIIFFERGIDRLRDRWIGSGERGDQFKDARHPYAEDLDLFGRGSLFELLCTAGTSSGMNTLAAWLKTPANPQEIGERQAAVEELRSWIRLREDLAVLGTDIGSVIDSKALSDWGSAEPAAIPHALRIAPAILALLAVATLIWWSVHDERIWFAGMVAVEGAFALWLRRRVRHIIQSVEQPCRDLSLLSQILRRLEAETFRTPLLQRLRLGLTAAGKPPSHQIASLSRLVVLLDSRRNLIFAPLAGLLLWGTQFSFAIEAWRIRSGKALAGWLAAVGEIEALCALAGYAFEHPADPFPELIGDTACFEAEAMAHPLLPESRSVRNDVSLGGELHALVVSGSNMSGKSTLLRTIGVNTVLALAGGPVRARRLRLSPLALGASIRIMDSLQEGSSRFYAEITRIRQIVDLTANERPVLFLLDELLQGTNSHDRRIGAEAIIKGLLARGAIGLLTTHDLALSKIAETLAPAAGNVHFEDRIENGRIAFDYLLRPGTVQRSNALELMRSVGLEV